MHHRLRVESKGCLELFNQLGVCQLSSKFISNLLVLNKI